MFEDIDNRGAPASISPESSDREIVYAIWSRSDRVGLSAERAWEVLHDRYPDDPRFLLLKAFEELAAKTLPRDWTPSSFLTKVRTILDGAGGRLHPEVRDLLAIAEDHLHPLSEADAAHLDRIRSRVGARPGDPRSAERHLSRVRLDLVRELHDRTASGKLVGPPPSGSFRPPSGADWKELLKDAKGKRLEYSATSKLGVGDVVNHPKFGEGVVTALEPGRAQILFESGARKLLCG